GALTSAVVDTTVEYNEVQNNGTWQTEWTTGGNGPLGSGGPNTSGRDGACKFWDTQGMWVHHNWIHHNQHVAVWADTNNVEFLMEDNLVEDNFGEGVFYEISYNFCIRRNRFRRNAI